MDGEEEMGPSADSDPSQSGKRAASRVRAHALRLHLNGTHRSDMKVCGSL